MKIWPFFSTKPSALPVRPAAENGCSKPAALSKFSLIPRLFPNDGKFGVYFKISAGGDIRTAAIIGRYTVDVC